MARYIISLEYLQATLTVRDPNRFERVVSGIGSDEVLTSTELVKIPCGHGQDTDALCLITDHESTPTRGISIEVTFRGEPD